MSEILWSNPVLPLSGKDIMRASMEVTDLLPCPFCGKKPLSHCTINEKTKNVVAHIFCSGCGAQLHQCLGSAREKAEEAVAILWNRRMPPGVGVWLLTADRINWGNSKETSAIVIAPDEDQAIGTCCNGSDSPWMSVKTVEKLGEIPASVVDQLTKKMPRLYSGIYLHLFVPCEPSL